ncbi:MAG: hypothetical protein AAFR55_04185, partial [Pseudomonadota bacterium]
QQFYGDTIQFCVHAQAGGIGLVRLNGDDAHWLAACRSMAPDRYGVKANIRANIEEDKRPRPIRLVQSAHQNTALAMVPVMHARHGTLLAAVGRRK